MYDHVVADALNPEMTYATLKVLQRITKRYNPRIVWNLRDALHYSPSMGQKTTEVKNLLGDRGLKVVQSQTRAQIRLAIGFPFGIVVRPHADRPSSLARWAPESS